MSTKKSQRHVWIVEVSWNDGRGLWHPTVGIGLTQKDAYRERADWQRRNPDERFRVVRYERAR